MSMWLLGKRLERAGFSPRYFGYFVSRHSLDTIVEQLVDHIRTHETSGEPYAIVGHSLGGVLARLAAPKLPVGLSSIVMLASPNRASSLARVLRTNLIFRALTRDAGQKLADQAFFESVPKPHVPTLVLAGDSVRGLPLHPHRAVPGDGVVRVDETVLDCAEHETLPGIHTIIMNSTRVAQRVTAFIRRARTETRL
jgi:hypothetical protein